MDALVAEVKPRAKGHRSPRLPRGFDATFLARREVEPLLSIREMAGAADAGPMIDVMRAYFQERGG